MSSAQQSSPRPLGYNVILLGKTGCGKSASGNTILGKKVFNSKKSPKAVTQEVQMESVTIDGVTLHVYDTPGLFNPETSNEAIINKWRALLQLDESARTVFLLVMKTDRLASEDKQAVDLMEEFIPEQLLQNTWILFTRGDELDREDLTIEECIEDTEGVKDVVQRFQNRYHVFNNYSESPEQVKQLINKIRDAPGMTSPEKAFPQKTLLPEEDPLHRRIVLVGKTGSGKSAAGNTILGEKRFRSELSSSSITSESEIHHGVVSGRNVSVIDTPAASNTIQSHEELAEEIGRSIYLSSPGPHAFLYVQPINIRFTEQEENIIERLELMFGREMRRYTMVLFTYGDLLEEKSVDVIIQENRSLRRLVEECGGRYHIFNNKQLRNREQVRELLQKIDRMVEENGGTCYSTEMYEEAARLRREEEEERRREEEERLRREEEERRREEAERHRREEEEERYQKQLEEEDKDKERKFMGSLKKYRNYLIIIGWCVVTVGGAICGTVLGDKLAFLEDKSLSKLIGALITGAGTGIVLAIGLHKLVVKNEQRSQSTGTGSEAHDDALGSSADISEDQGLEDNISQKPLMRKQDSFPGQQKGGKSSEL